MGINAGVQWGVTEIFKFPFWDGNPGAKVSMVNPCLQEHGNPGANANMVKLFL